MKIKRQTHLVAFGAPITVYVGDHKKISLKNGDQIEYHIQGDYVDLSLKHSKQPPKGRQIVTA
ncbi:hypothetical protein N1496_02105 [Streptococcus didelphis]|uniref:Uncharacterized protein n=1 Tax=Streptococcus didelphis TaxID=102886 RepID=A0ABY9LI74_9STRE|nr:hypothetical protein [Streptococcus didelphis]WMB28423.1 hypothetical protein N1496_02105 [Streptococcus didelphis]